MIFPPNDISQYELVRPNRLAKQIVFADGIGSSGKGMLSHLNASLHRVEKQSNHSVFDFVSYLHWLGKMSDDAAVTYLQTEADMQLYYIMMGRNVNFRPKDSTGVLQNPRKLEYFKRLFLEEGESVVSRIGRDNPILNEAPHDSLRSAPLFFEAFGESLRIVYIIRDCFELTLDWVRRGFGERIGTDPREFQFSLKIEGTVVPMFMLDSGFDYYEANPVERVLLMLRFCFKTNLQGYEKLHPLDREWVKFIHFNQLLLEPSTVMREVASFLGTETTRRTRKTIKKEGIPRPLQNHSDLRREVIQSCRPEFLPVIDELADLHDQLVEHASHQ